MPTEQQARAVVRAAPWLIIALLVLTALRALLVSEPYAPEPRAWLPSPTPPRPRTAALAIVDAELVLGPPAVGFDAAAFVAARGGALAAHGEPFGGVRRSGGDIVKAAAEDHSVNPRVLLVMLQLATGVVDGGAEDAMDAPLGPMVAAAQGTGLRPALGWLASTLNAAYYGMRLDGVASITTPEGGAWTATPPAGAGQVAVASALAQLDGSSDLTARLAEFAALYAHWFGPLPPEPDHRAAGSFPPLLLPWMEGQTWHFTGGPHEAWGRGTPLGAVDFAPPSPNGCGVAAEPAVAAAPGVVAISRDGYVLLDLDGDGHVATGPVLQYLHMAEAGRAPVGAVLEAGDPIGHPSCEGGYATGSHVHFARRLDGEWLPIAGGREPLALSDWRFEGGDQPYEGRMVHHAEGVRSALKRRNGDATGVRSDNGPARRSVLASAWSAAAAAGAQAVAPPLEAAAGAMALSDPPPAAPLMTVHATERQPTASGGIADAPAALGDAPSLTIRLRLTGRQLHDTAFVLALEGPDGLTVPLVGHTDALGVGFALTLPPGLHGAYDLTVRVPGFVEARAHGVPLGDGPVDVDFTAGGAVALRAGDLDGDGDVGLGDAVQWIGAARRGLPEADLDASGEATLSDLWRVVRGSASRG